ncbi:hypothetical protein AOX56_09320 [Aeromonas sobria]|uniref:Uncharacterized protein n=1 Tax=Aeromonas sobria TaxID=646 RepID=A0A2N3IL43_AERSO|nr:hypothetical protein AOX56_09320 [Aeromonas sobria]
MPTFAFFIPARRYLMAEVFVAGRDVTGARKDQGDELLAPHLIAHSQGLAIYAKPCLPKIHCEQKQSRDDRLVVSDHLARMTCQIAA